MEMLGSFRLNEGVNGSTIIYRRSAHGGGWGERICSDGSRDDSDVDA